jgi:hypothetical protein
MIKDDPVGRAFFLTKTKGFQRFFFDLNPGKWRTTPPDFCVSYSI